jgi:hypothetical protein
MPMARAAAASAVFLFCLPALAAPRAQDCALGFLAWCVWRTDAAPQERPTRLRLEAFGGYKFASSFYRAEARACEAAGCALKVDGPMLGFDAFLNVLGRPASDDYFDLGLSYLNVPVVSGLERNLKGFEGELGPIGPGDGALDYAVVRVALRRPSLFYLVKSKYLISSFGLGVAFPVGRGAGIGFTGADGPKFSLGGRLGVQLPVNRWLSLGVAAQYGVIWYGPRFEHVAFTGGYGVNVQWLL